jgi:hypothetical protein
MPPDPKVDRDLVMCEFGSDHVGTKMWSRILTNTTQVTQVFEAGLKPGAGRTEREVSVGEKPRTLHFATHGSGFHIYDKPTIGQLGTVFLIG